MNIKLMLARGSLKRAYLAYRAEADRMSCGAALSNHITNGRLDALRDAVNYALEECRKLDPSCNVQPLK